MFNVVEIYSVFNGTVVIFFDESEWGHVAIIMAVDSNQVQIIQQNWDRDTAYRILPLTKNPDNTYHVGSQLWPGSATSYEVLGWLSPKSLIRSMDAIQDDFYWFQNMRLHRIADQSAIALMNPFWTLSESLEYTPETFSTEFSANLGYSAGPAFLNTDSTSNGLLIKLQDDSQTFVMENGIKRPLTAEEMADTAAYNPDDVIVVTQSLFDTIEKEDPVIDEYYILSGKITDANVSTVNGTVYAYEQSGANQGNSASISNSSYEMALFPGTYGVYAYLYKYSLLSQRYRHHRV